MGNKKWTRVAALCLAAVCTLSVVLAAELQFDMNRDGKTTVWDLQKVLKDKPDDYAAAVGEALDGKGDELNPVNGVYEIWTELGLRNMVKRAKDGCNFKLMADIDLGGMNWTPIADFKGTFNGNEHTISNLTITKNTGGYMGFFANTVNKDNEDDRTLISNLYMEGVNIIVDDGDAVHNDGVQYVGAIVSSNCGDVEGCTAVSTVTDQRTTLAKDVYYGTLVGQNAEGLGKLKNCVNALNVDVNITKKSSFTDAVITNEAYQGSRTVNSKMATFFGTLSAESAGARCTGIAGYSSPDGLDTSLRWQDITNSTDLAAEALQTRRELAAAEMYEMCTVPWTPTNTMTFYNYEAKTDDAGNVIPVLHQYSTLTGGILRKGLPYSMGSTSLACFKAHIGNYTTEAAKCWPGVSYRLPAGADILDTGFLDDLNAAYEKYKENPDATDEAGVKLVDTYPQLPLMQSTVTAGAVVGFAQYLGTDCSSQVAWAWRKVSASSVETTAGAVKLPGGGQEMIPSYGKAGTVPASNNIDKFGIVPVNGLILDYAEDLNNDGAEYTTVDKSILFSDTYVENKTRLWDTLAKVTKGDALLHYSFNGGHVVLALSDAVVIRDHDGDIDTKLSYIVTAEQGGDPKGVDSDGINHYNGKTDDGKTWKSDCCVDRRTTFHDLTEKTLNASASNKMGRDIYHVWIPTSCDVLKNPDSAAATAWCKVEGDAITSNFPIVSYAVGDPAADGTVVYTDLTHNGFRRAEEKVTLEQLTAAFGDIEEKTVTVTLSNGQTFDIEY